MYVSLWFTVIGSLLILTVLVMTDGKHSCTQLDIFPSVKQLWKTNNSHFCSRLCLVRGLVGQGKWVLYILLFCCLLYVIDCRFYPKWGFCSCRLNSQIILERSMLFSFSTLWISHLFVPQVILTLGECNFFLFLQ